MLLDKLYLLCDFGTCTKLCKCITKYPPPPAAQQAGNLKRYPAFSMSKNGKEEHKMPCPHNEISIVQRSHRQSAVAAAAYQSGEKLFCEYDQEVKHYL